MNKTQLTIALGLALQAGAGYGDGYTFNANTGQLSYTYFNLNPNNVTVTPYASGANSYGQTSSLSTTTGWDNSGGSYGTAGDLSMFNSGLAAQTASKYCSNSDYHINSPIFFASNYDPVSMPTPTSATLGHGDGQKFVEQSQQSFELLNPPAMADSWSVVIDGSDNIVIANMASSSNMLVSGNNYYTQNWPFCYSYNGLYYNADLNPPDPYNTTSQNYTPPGETSSISQWTNPFGAGFVPAGQTMNLNVSPTATNYSPTGGLWSGINVNNGSNVAANSLNNAMYPINLTSYVLPTAARTVSGSGTINGSTYEYSNQYYDSIYGGHFTYAVGDPYVISSASAKMLWTWVTSPTYAFMGSSMSASDIATIQTIVAGAFTTSTDLHAYAQWLVGNDSTSGSPYLASQALTNALNAANVPITSTHVSLWGKIVNGMLRVAVDAGEAFAAISTGGGSVAAQMAVAGVTDATGAFGSVVTDAITNAATTTTTLSPPPPQSATAPPIVNNTYAASNLFGLMLANSFVQAEVNNANNLTSDSSSVLWSSASINVDGLCETGTASGTGAQTVAIDNSLISGSCYTTNSSGTLNNGSNGTTVALFNNVSGQTAQTYSNPLSLADNSQSTSQISLWNTVLTGSDITTNSSGAMLVANPTLSAFSPPVQMATAGGISSPITNVNTTFNLGSGMLSVASYTSNNGASTYSTLPPSPTPPPATVGKATGINEFPINPAGNPPGVTGYEFEIGGASSYNSSTGVVSLAGYVFYTFTGDRGTPQPQNNYYSFANGTQTLDMTTCEPGSQVTVTYDSTNLDFSTGTGASGSLSCSTPYPVVATGSYPVPTSWPTLTLAVSNPNGTTAYSLPTASTSTQPQTGAYYYDTSSGTLTVNGYAGANSQSFGYYALANGPQTLSLTTCPYDAVTLTLTPSTTSGNASGANGTLSCATPPSSLPNLTTVLGSIPSNLSSAPSYSNPSYTTTSPPAAGFYSYDSSTGVLTVNGYNGSDSSTTTATFGLANGAQSINVTTCPSNAVTLTLTPGSNTTSTDASGATGTLSCGTPPPITVVNAAASAANNTIHPGNVSFSGTTLTVGGFTVGTSTNVTQFTNIDPSQTAGAALTLDVSTCNQSMARSTLAYNSSTSSYSTHYTTVAPGVTLTVYPIGGSNASVMGVLSCQSPPTLSYNACASDPNASGGVVAVLTGPPLPNPQGATFELACTCVPSYLGGPNPVGSNAATTQSNFTSNNFIYTGGKDSNGNPNGVVVGATSTYPSQQCPTNW